MCVFIRFVFTTHVRVITIWKLHVCALTCYNRVVTIMFGHKRVRLCPDTFVPTHIFCALACYNKITKYSGRNTAGDC